MLGPYNRHSWHIHKNDLKFLEYCILNINNINYNFYYSYSTKIENYISYKKFTIQKSILKIGYIPFVYWLC